MARIKSPRSRPADSERYQEIVQTAGELFAEKGFDGTSLYDIADSVGLLKGSLYHYIESKEALLYDVIKLAHEGLAENIQSAERFSADPLRQLVAFAYGHIALNAVPERLSRGAVFLHESKKLSVDDSKRVMKDRDAYDRYLRSIIERGKAAGLFEAEIDTRICSFAVLGVMTSYLRWYKPQGPVTPQAIGREFAAFVVSAVTRDKSKHSRFKIVDQVIEEMSSTSSQLL